MLTNEIFLEDWNINQGPHRKVLFGGCEGSGVCVGARPLGRLIVYSGVSIRLGKGDVSAVTIIKPVVALHIENISFG